MNQSKIILIWKKNSERERERSNTVFILQQFSQPYQKPSYKSMLFSQLVFCFSFFYWLALQYLAGWSCGARRVLLFICFFSAFCLVCIKRGATSIKNVDTRCIKPATSKKNTNLNWYLKWLIFSCQISHCFISQKKNHPPIYEQPVGKKALALQYTNNTLKLCVDVFLNIFGLVRLCVVCKSCRYFLALLFSRFFN